MTMFAASALKFTNAYANSVCTPSRVSLMTGMNAAHHRVTNWTEFEDKAVDSRDSLLAIPDWNVNGLSPKPGQPRSVYATPLAQILKDNGYYTIQCGKAHFGAYKTIGSNPINLGFVKNIGGSAAGNPASYLAESDFGYNPDRFILQADIPNMKKYWGTPTFLTEEPDKRSNDGHGHRQDAAQTFLFIYGPLCRASSLQCRPKICRKIPGDGLYQTGSGLLCFGGGNG